MTTASGRRPKIRLALGVLAGIAIGTAAGQGIGAMKGPTEHQGLTVDTLAVVPEAVMQASIGLAGYQLQLRAITIEPGGQIAEHEHATRPGLVKVISGDWVEGRPGGEETYGAERRDGIVEDNETVHWFFNRGDVPATALVCDLVPPPA